MRVLDATGNIITEGSDILRVWKEHFDNLLNKEPVVSDTIPHSLSSPCITSGLEEPISTDEIDSVIKHLSNHKAAGPDSFKPLSLRKVRSPEVH